MLLALRLFSARRLRWERSFVLRRWRLRGALLSLLCLDLLDGSLFLRGFGVGFANALPQSPQRVRAGLRAQPVIRAESLHDGLNNFFLELIGTSIPFPIIEHFRESANDGAITISVFVFKTKKFA